MAGVLTFAEHREGKLRRPSLEAISEARRLADALGATVSSVLIGPGVRALASEAAHYGADQVHVFEDAALAAYATEAYARSLVQVIEDLKPAVVSAQKGLNEPRYASLKGIMAAKKKTIEALDAAALNLDKALLAPRVRVTGLELPPARPAVRMIEGDPGTQAKELLRLLHEEAKVI